MRDGKDWFEVHGTAGAPFMAAELDSLGDHRLAMAWAVAGLRADGPVTIDAFDACSVSYPDFAGRPGGPAGERLGRHRAGGIAAFGGPARKPVLE